MFKQNFSDLKFWKSNKAVFSATLSSCSWICIYIYKVWHVHVCDFAWPCLYAFISVPSSNFVNNCALKLKSMHFVVMTMCSMVKWSCFVFRWMHCGMSFHSRVVIVVTACTVRLPPCMNNIWTNRYYTLLEVDCHSYNILTLIFWFLNILCIYLLGRIKIMRMYTVVFYWEKISSKVVVMSRLFPLRCFYIKDLEVYVLMLTWEVWTLWWVFACQYCIRMNKIFYCIFCYIYIYFFVVNESPLPTILHDILFPHLLNLLYKISQKTMI